MVTCENIGDHWLVTQENQLRGVTAVIRHQKDVEFGVKSQEQINKAKSMDIFYEQTQLDRSGIFTLTLCKRCL